MVGIAVTGDIVVVGMNRSDGASTTTTVLGHHGLRAGWHMRLFVYVCGAFWSMAPGRILFFKVKA